MNDLTTFEKRLEWAMKVRRIGKMYTLATAMDVDESAISRWRHNKPISTANLVKLCTVLKISADWLLSGEGDMNRQLQAAETNWENGFAQDMFALGIGNPAGIKCLRCLGLLPVRQTRTQNSRPALEQKENTFLRR